MGEGGGGDEGHEKIKKLTHLDEKLFVVTVNYPLPQTTDFLLVFPNFNHFPLPASMKGAASRDGHLLKIYKIK